MEQKDVFLRKIEEMLGQPAGSLTGTTPLAELSFWDSLAIIGVVALADGEYHVSVQPDALAEAKTLYDIFDVLFAK